jgi:hypothetical protein
MHKLIYKFVDDMENFSHDVRAKIEEEQGKGKRTELVGQAHVSQIYNIKETKKNSSKMI